MRQGKFFFIPVAGEELKRFVQLGRNVAVRRSVGIAAAAGWSRAGRQHVASEVWAVAPSIAMVRGHVAHPDHKTRHFPEWVRVLQNREAYEAPPPGVLWVD